MAIISIKRKPTLFYLHYVLIFLVALGVALFFMWPNEPTRGGVVLKHYDNPTVPTPSIVVSELPKKGTPTQVPRDSVAQVRTLSAPQILPRSSEPELKYGANGTSCVDTDYMEHLPTSAVVAQSLVLFSGDEWCRGGWPISNVKDRPDFKVEEYFALRKTKIFDALRWENIEKIVSHGQWSVADLERLAALEHDLGKDAMVILLQALHKAGSTRTKELWLQWVARKNAIDCPFEFTTEYKDFFCK